MSQRATQLPDPGNAAPCQENDASVKVIERNAGRQLLRACPAVVCAISDLVERDMSLSSSPSVGIEENVRERGEAARFRQVFNELEELTRKRTEQRQSKRQGVTCSVCVKV